MCTTHTRCQHQTASCAWVLEALGCHISPAFLQHDPGISSTWENSPVRDIQTSICSSLKHPHFRLSPKVLPSSGAWPFRVPANTTCPVFLAALRHIPNGRSVEMICVWNLGQNYVSNNQFYLTSHLLSSSSTSLLDVGTEVLEGEEGRAAVLPQHLDRPTSRKTEPRGGFLRPALQSLGSWHHKTVGKKQEGKKL